MCPNLRIYLVLTGICSTALAEISSMQNGAIASETKGIRLLRNAAANPDPAPDQTMEGSEGGQEARGRSVAGNIGGLLMGIGGALAIQKAHQQGIHKFFPWLPGGGAGSLVEEADVTYQLYTKKNKKEPVQIDESNIKGPDDLEKWNVDNGVIILVHGWMENVNTATNFAQKVKNAYLEEMRNENIILVDWEKHAGNSNYEDSAKAAPQVGKLLGDFILKLKELGLVTEYENIHIIGFNLGAHIAGIAGNVIQSKSDGKKIGRITGLDPAWEFFGEDIDEERRLSSDDAEYVDVIHCNMGDKKGKFGTSLAIGTSDWFPNGGSIQPVCDISGIGEPLGICSTNKCYEYYADSITGKKFKGCQCESYDAFKGDECDCKEEVLMGEPAPKTAKGKFYLKT